MRDNLGEEYSTSGAAMHARKIRQQLDPRYAEYRKSLAEHGDAKAQEEATAMADQTRAATAQFIEEHAIGTMWKVDINSDLYSAVVTNIRTTHKEGKPGNPYSLSKLQVSVAVNGGLRHLTVPATQFARIDQGRIGYGSIESQMRVVAQDRETAKIITGNLLGAYGELQGTRGSIISFTKQDGTSELGILLPKSFTMADNTKGGYRLRSGADAVRFLRSGAKDIATLGISSRDQAVRVTPAANGGITIRVPKSKAKGAKYFLDKAIRAVTGDFATQGDKMVANVPAAKAPAAIDAISKKVALYSMPSHADDARAMFSDTPKFRQRSSGAPGNVGQQQLQETVAALRTGWANAPEISVLGSLIEAPKQVQDEVARVQAEGGEAPAGVYHDGQVLLFADQVRSPEDAIETVFHEVLGHHGLQGTFGSDLGGILRQIAYVRRAEVSRIIARNGFREHERLRAAEELLAEMAQSRPQLGFVQRAIAAIKSALRRAGLLSADKLSDAEIVRDYIEPARRWVESGGKATAPGAGLASPNSGKPMFSQVRSGISTPSEYWKAGMDAINEYRDTPGKLNWWQKTFGTPYDLAQRHPKTFGRVYDKVQQFLGDISHFATQAADQAPRILPKLDTWRDAFKTPLSAKDTKAIQAPVFEGTLKYARDRTTGKPILVSELEERFKPLDVHGRANMLLGASAISPQDLERVRNLSMEAYEGYINNRFEQEFMSPGIVWTDDELKSMFKLTDGENGQISLYRETRKAIDTSLRTFTLSHMLNLAGKDARPIAETVMAQPTLEEGSNMLSDYLMSLEESGTPRSKVLTDTAAKVVALAQRGQRLIERGYAPLSRFGKYTVDVVGPSGERCTSVCTRTAWRPGARPPSCTTCSPMPPSAAAPPASRATSCSRA
jgi:hypothetical protein